MWSGDTHSQGGSYPTQWALNPSAYMNIPNEQVDWATLAQQWIKMKEGLPPAEKEEGEAPMEITKDDSGPTDPPEEVSASQPNWPPTNQPIDGVWPNNWGWDQGGGWCWGGMSSGDSKATSTFSAGYTSVPEPAVVPHNQGTTPTPYPFPSQPTNSHHYSSNPGYWTGDADLKETWDSPSTRGHRKQSSISEPITELDSTKRKQLPAWIREGLEKMEREKQKKAENERLDRERREQISKRQDEREEKKVLTEANGSPAIPKKSKFESDSEESEVEKETPAPREKSVEKPHRSRFDWRGPEPSPPPRPTHRTKEEILQHVMVQVRKILTQLLTEVTSEEIMAVCEQVHNQYQRKAPATTVRKTPALASLTGKLGLGIYDSDSGSESSGEADTANNGADSDQELRERIRRRKEEFVETERRIEREIAEQEEKEKRVLLGKQSVSREASPDTEEQVQPTQQGAATDTKLERKLSKDSSEAKSNEGREPKHDVRERHEVKRETDKSLKKSERKAHKHSSLSSSSSEYSRSPSPYRRRKHGRHRKDKRSSRRSRSVSRSRERSRTRSRERRKDHRRKERRYRSRSSSRGRRRRSSERRARHRSTSSSSGGIHNKRSSHRR